MLVLVAQCVTAAVVLAFGVIAMHVARQQAKRALTDRALCWFVVGTGFSAVGLIKVAGEAWAARAFVAGPGSELWDSYLAMAPAINHSRGFVVAGTVLLLAGIPYSSQRSLRAYGILSTFALVAAGAVGIAAGLLEGGFLNRTHHLALGVTGAVTIVVLGGALISHLVKDTMDRLLFVCLCVYGFHLAVGSIWAAALSWKDTPGIWQPSLLLLSVGDLLAAGSMLGIAVYALVLTRRGGYIPALLEHPQPLKTAALP